MTKVADAVAADGSTDWFKIKEIGPTFSGGQAKWDMSSKYICSVKVPVSKHFIVSYSVSLPSCIPAGDYLLRIEQLGIHNPGSTPQFYGKIF